MLTVSGKIKKLFFDRLAVKQAVDKDRLRFLRNAGRYAQKTARTSIKRKGRARKPPKNLTGKAYERWQREVEERHASPPGSPPFAHTDHKVFTIKNILFAYDPATGGTIVGPVGLNSNAVGRMGTMVVPELLEFGGRVGVLEKLENVSPPRVRTGGKRVLTPVQKQKMLERLQAKGKQYTPGTRWVPRGKRLKPGQPVRARMAEYAPRPFMAPAISKTKEKFGQLWFSNRGGRSEAG